MDHSDAQFFTEQEMGSLYKDHYKQLCLVAMNYVRDIALAQDIVQDFFINYWERRSQGIEAPDNFKNYASRAVRNMSIDRLRRKLVEDGRKENLNIHPDLDDSFDLIAEQEELDAYHRRLKRIFELIEQLPESQRTVLKLHALDKLSYAQIAAQQNISINTVRTHLTRAYSSLRKSTAGLLLLSLLRYL